MVTAHSTSCTSFPPLTTICSNRFMSNYLICTVCKLILAFLNFFDLKVGRPLFEYMTNCVFRLCGRSSLPCGKCRPTSLLVSCKIKFVLKCLCNITRSRNDTTCAQIKIRMGVDGEHPWRLLEVIEMKRNTC